MAAAALLLTAQGGRAATPLAPGGTWTVDVANGQCALKRAYGTGNAMQLGIWPVTGGEQVRILMRGHDPAWRSRQGFAQIALDGKIVAHDLPYVTARDARTDLRSTLLGVKRSELAGLGAAATMRVKAGGQPETVFSLSGIGEALGMLEDCESKLARGWGVDYDPRFQGPDAASKARNPKPRAPEKWLDGYQYPWEALRHGQIGKTMFRLTVDAQGRPTDCTIIISSNWAALDEATCAAMRARASFDPALDEKGNPRPGIWATVFRWEMQ